MAWKNKVVWTEGMFLRPQHFQQQERYFRQWVESRCADLIPFSWGVTQLSVDAQLLSLGKFGLSSCRGVFPDGTPFDTDVADPLPQPLEIPADTREAIVYLALPLARDSGRDIPTASHEEELARYRLIETEARDTHTPTSSNGTESIETGELNLSLRLSAQDIGAYTTVPIARITERRADNQVILEQAYIPSCLNCAGSPLLIDIIQDLLGLLHHRGETLAKRLGSPGAGGVAEVADFLLLMLINRYEPLFAHLDQLHSLHPEALYRTLLQMAGELTTITLPGRRPEEYPHYQHENLAGSFQPVVKSIRESLNWIPETRAVPIPLELHKYGIRTATIHDHELLASADFVLAVNAQVSSDNLRKNFPKQTTVATVEKLRDLVMTHTPGIELRPLAVAPRQIPYHSGFTYFQLDKHGDLWKELAETGAIAMHFAGDFPGLELEFWAIRG
ncbi:MAG TPA: type VI secretion system baseplate subunit TssK [Gammaproteobacteria bacterium]|nr:type VI secretion system baseplate subunit TssK [Gammaproteobacteria bacterium]